MGLYNMEKGEESHLNKIDHFTRVIFREKIKTKLAERLYFFSYKPSDYKNIEKTVERKWNSRNGH